MIVSILVDNKNSWFMPYAKKLCDKLKRINIKVVLANDQDVIPKSDVCFLLSCTKIVTNDFLKRNKHNIVVHASDLPEGKGFTPIKWQILEGKNDIVVTLFEAVEAIDAGDYYIKSTVHFDGYELLDEIHNKLAELIINMCIDFINNINVIHPLKQNGIETIYRRFNNEDDRLDINKTIIEQFNHFRIADNENHPVWFEIDNHKYYIKIYKSV